MGNYYSEAKTQTGRLLSTWIVGFLLGLALFAASL